MSKLYNVRFEVYVDIIGEKIENICKEHMIDEGCRMFITARHLPAVPKEGSLIPIDDFLLEIDTVIITPATEENPEGFITAETHIELNTDDKFLKEPEELVLTLSDIFKNWKQVRASNLWEIILESKSNNLEDVS